MVLDIDSAIVGPTCHDAGIRGHGYADPEGKQVMFVGISPGREEMRTGIPMTGQSGKLTNAILKACGWSRDRIYVTNMVCTQCNVPTLEQILDCKPRLDAEIALVKPKLVVLLGKEVVQNYFGDRPMSTPNGNGVRGIIDWYDPWNCYIMPTFHPAALLHGEGTRFIQNDLVRDFSKIREFFDYPPVLGRGARPSFTVVHSREQAQAVLDVLPRDTFVALDIETPLKDEDETASIEDPISCFSISDGVHTWWFPGELAAQVTWPLDVQWTLHNGPYDTVAIAQRTGTLLPIVHDTMYMSNALDERGGVHGLKWNLRETEAVGFYEEEWGKGAQAIKKRNPETRKYEVVVTKWDARRRADPEGFQLYNVIDAYGTARLAQRYYRRMVQDGMLDMYTNLLLPAVNTYRLMQRHGVKVDHERVTALLSAWIPLRDQKIAALQKMARELGGPDEINPASPQQIGKFLFGTLRLPGGRLTKSGNPSTGKDVIELLAGQHPFVDGLVDIRHLNKALGTYVVGLWPSVKQSTMRVHPWAKLHGSMTGRVAYFNPAINTTPRAYSPNPYLSKLKYLFVAPPGKVLIEMDYKQAEVWMAAVYCDDPQMWADLAAGDFHRRTAAYINKCEMHEVDEWQRARAKNSTFGKFFLIGVDKFAKQNKITKDEAKTYMSEWDARYPMYKKYVDACYLEACNTGELVTITGRKRRYPCAGALGDTSIMPETTNFKIQATSHDCLMSSIVEAFPVVESLGGSVILDIHDAMLIEADARNWQEVAYRVAEIMQKPRFPGLPRLPVEVKVGPSWAELEEVHLPAMA